MLSAQQANSECVPLSPLHEVWQVLFEGSLCCKIIYVGFHEVLANAAQMRLLRETDRRWLPPQHLLERWGASASPAASPSYSRGYLRKAWQSARFAEENTLAHSEVSKV